MKTLGLVCIWAVLGTTKIALGSHGIIVFQHQSERGGAAFVLGSIMAPVVVLFQLMYAL